MLFLKHLESIGQHELQGVGQRALDLALIRDQHLPIAPTVIVLSSAFDETVRKNNLKYKIDYLLSHAQKEIPSTLANAYSGARKAFAEAILPTGLPEELKSQYDAITQPPTVGELSADRPSVRVLLSMNTPDDPENNDTIIQNVTSYDQLLVAVREAFALAYHPTQLGRRQRERFSENNLKVALIIQAMEETPVTCHAYSCLIQDHSKIFLQAYYGQLDLRERITKDYYALRKHDLTPLHSKKREQHTMLAKNEHKDLVPLPAHPGEKLLPDEITELARLTRKIERAMGTPIKLFFAVRPDEVLILFANRQNFAIITTPEETPAPVMPSPAPVPIPEPTPAPATVLDIPQVTAAPLPAPSAEDFIAEAIKEEPAITAPALAPPMPTPSVDGVAAKLLNASLRIVHQVIERKYRGTFGETDPTGNLRDMANRLNQANVFSRNVDAELLLQAEEAARQEGRLDPSEYAKTIEEVAFIMSYA